MKITVYIVVEEPGHHYYGIAGTAKGADDLADVLERTKPDVVSGVIVRTVEVADAN